MFENIQINNKKKKYIFFKNIKKGLTAHDTCK